MELHETRSSLTSLRPQAHLALILQRLYTSYYSLISFCLTSSLSTWFYSTKELDVGKTIFTVKESTLYLASWQKQSWLGLCSQGCLHHSRQTLTCQPFPNSPRIYSLECYRLRSTWYRVGKVDIPTQNDRVRENARAQSQNLYFE